MLRAIEDYAQYCIRQAPNSDAINTTPTKHPYRTIFECDRDRVMYCSSFRRLSSKTQIFITSASDNLRTRLTHTLEVSQIARTIAKQLSLDVDLAEAIALGHDLGHTPFGHVGERTIHLFSIGDDKKQKKSNVSVEKSMYGFKYNLQSVRILTEYSENVKFTNFMLYGVREHSKRYWKSPDDVCFYSMYDAYCSYKENDTLYPAWSFEAFIVKWADEIAQRHHDLEDAYLQKIMNPNDIVEKLRPILKIINNNDYIENKFNRLEVEAQRVRKKSTYPIASFAHTLSSFLVDAYVTIICVEFDRILSGFCCEYNINSAADFKKAYTTINEADIIKLMSLDNTQLKTADIELGKTLKNSILDSYEFQKMDGKGAFIVRKLLRAYISNPQQLPDDYINRFIKIELRRNLPNEVFSVFTDRLKDENAYFASNMNTWQVYECRQALSIIKSDSVFPNKPIRFCLE